jgi:hypothetical protein
MPIAAKTRLLIATVERLGRGTFPTVLLIWEPPVFGRQTEGARRFRVLAAFEEGFFVMPSRRPPRDPMRRRPAVLLRSNRLEPRAIEQRPPAREE